MQLVKAHIFGFGNWVDETFDFSKDGFLCFYGENETGKSTLRQFLLFMLFGSTPKKRAFYQPKTSGRMGGRLTVKDNVHGFYTIERMHHVRNGAAVCEMENGDTHQEDWLKERLNGMTRETYEAIFSFSALDLTDLRHMKAEDLGDVLLGVGLTGSSGIHRIEKKLEAEMGEWFKPSGKNPIINKQLRLLDDQKKRISELKKTEGTYRDKKHQLNEAETSLERLKEHVHTIQNKRRKLEKEINALPLLKDYDASERELKQYPDEMTFPDHGIARFEKLEDQLLPLKGEYAALEKTAEQYQEALIEFEKRKCTEEHLQTVQNILEDQNTRKDLQREINMLNEQIEKLSFQIEGDLRALGIDLQQDDLEHIDLPFGTEKRWESLKEHHTEIASEKKRLEEQHHLLLREQEVLEQDLESAKSKLLDEKELSGIKTLLEADHEQNNAQQYTRHAKEQHHQWQHMKRKRHKRLSITLWAAFALGGMAAVSGWLLSNMIFLWTAGIIMVYGAVQYYFGKRSLNDLAAMFTANTPKHTQAALSEAERTKLEADFTQHHEAEDVLKDLRAAEKSNYLEWLKWEEKKNALDIKIAQHEQAIEDEKQTYPFLSQVAITYWPELFLKLHHIMGRFAEKTTHIQGRTTLERKSYELLLQSEAFYEHMNWPFSCEETNVWGDLTAYLEEQRHIRHQIETHTAAIKEHHAHLDALKENVQTYEREQAQLFNQAHVSDEEAFREKAAQVENKQHLNKHMNDIQAQLSHRFSREEQYQLLAQASRDQETWQEDMNALQRQQKELEEKLEEERAKHARLHAEMKQMESGEDLSRLQHQFTNHQEELNKQAEKWAILAAAKGVLNDAKRTFREKYMDKIIRQTSLYFNTLTKGRYSNVFGPDDMDGALFRVEQYDGVRFDVTELSQGTLDQLYVSLRLAIGCTMSDVHNFPYMIDDAFVHFDHQRTGQVLSLLEEISTRQQILLFTCKKDIVQTVDKDKTVYLNESVRNADNLVIK